MTPPKPPIKPELPTGKLLTVKEVAEKCRVSRASVHYWIQEERLTTYKVGRCLLVTEESLAKLFAQSRRGPMTAAQRELTKPEEIPGLPVFDAPRPMPPRKKYY